MTEYDITKNIQKPYSVNPYCIYHSNNIDNIYGLIKSPLRVKKKNGDEVLQCYLNPIMKNWKYYASFYAINPMIQPIPTGLHLICAKLSQEFPYNTISIDIIYDTFRIDDNCVYFMTWTLPVPYTVPLYLYSTSSGISITFQEHKDMKQLNISPLYVLSNFENKPDFFKDFKKLKNGEIDFTFANNQGRCLPNPYGNSLSKCLVLSNENITDLEYNGGPPTLLQHLERIEKKKEKNISKLFQKIPSIAIAIILLFFSISFFTIIILLYDHK
jgi:hypothetical protein